MSVFKNEGRFDRSNTRVRGAHVVRYEKGSDDPALDHIDYGALALRRELVEALPPEIGRASCRERVYLCV